MLDMKEDTYRRRQMKALMTRILFLADVWRSQTRNTAMPKRSISVIISKAPRT